MGINLEDYNNNDLFWKDFSTLPNNPYKLNTSLDTLDCLFVFPTKKDDFSKGDYPISFGNMASLLRMNEGKLEIFLQDIDVYNPEKFKKRDLICFYPMVASLHQMMEIPRKIKNDYPNSKICFFNSEQHQHEMLLCNPQAKNFARKLMEKYSFLDYMLIGEAESSFIKLCEKIVRKDNNFKDIPLCLYRESGEIKSSEKSIKPIEFQFFPFPSRDHLEKSISTKGINLRSPRIQSSRGCISPCLYCVESRSNITIGGRKRPVLSREVHQFINEIEMLQKNYGIVFFNIIDSSFEDPGIKRMKIFCDEIINRDIEASFKIHLRAETVSKLDDKFLDDLKYAGVDIISVGVESGLEKELRSYKKITSTKKSIDAIQRLESSGRFFSVLGYMMFSPILNLDDLPKKMEFLKKLGHNWDYLDMSNNVLIFPGTAYHQHIDSLGLTINCNELSTTIPYRFKDEKVRFVAQEIGELKTKCPEVIQLNNKLYDLMNLISRYHNKMNKHLLENQEAFNSLKQNSDSILPSVGGVYNSYFTDLIDLVESNYSKEKADLIYKKHIPAFFPIVLNKTNKTIEDFIKSCEDKNLSTDKLYLKTWMSIINTQINTSGGTNE